MSFEDDFPSLNDKIVNKLKKGTGGFAGKGQRADYVEIIHISELCIDKQKVKDVLLNKDCYIDTDIGKVLNIDEVMKRLGIR